MREEVGDDGVVGEGGVEDLGEAGEGGGGGVGEGVEFVGHFWGVDELVRLQRGGGGGEKRGRGRGRGEGGWGGFVSHCFNAGWDEARTMYILLRERSEY